MTEAKAAYYELLDELVDKGLSSTRLEAILDVVQELVDTAEDYDAAAELYLATMHHDEIGEAFSSAHCAQIIDIVHDLDRRKSYYFCGEVLESAFLVCAKLEGMDAETTKTLLYEYAENLRVREHYIEAAYRFDELHSAATRSSLDRGRVGLLYKNQGLSLLRAGFLQDARKLLEMAREFFLEFEEPDSVSLPEVRQGLAEIAFLEGNHSMVLRIFDESISGERASLGFGLIGLTALTMPRDGSFKHFDIVKANVDQSIDQMFETELAYDPFSFQQLCYLFQAAFLELLEEPDAARFTAHLDRFAKLAELRLMSIASLASNSSMLALTSAVSDTLDRILSIVIEHGLTEAKILRSILALGQITKGTVTRLLRGRRVGSATSRWSPAVRQWYSSVSLDWQYSDTRRDYEKRPTFANLYRMERCDRALSERMTDWNAHRFLGLNSDPPKNDTVVLEYFSFARSRTAGSKDGCEAWVTSILRCQDRDRVAQMEEGSVAEELVFTDHGPAQSLSSAIDGLRQALFLTMQMGDGHHWQPRATYLGRTLVPKLPLIPDRLKLIIIPDEHVHLVPFDVLITNEGKSLAEQFTLSFAKSWLDIDDLIITRGVGLAPVCVGDPDFTMANAMHCLDESFGDARLGAVWAVLDRQPFADFESAGRLSETEEVASVIGVSPLVGQEAIATELKRLNSPAILHVSTHGFYIGKEQIRAELVGATQTQHDPNEAADHEINLDTLFRNPQNRSGLVFAGANLHLEGKHGHPMLNEGFAFASDIQALDLRHTELVTLSACVTGMGDEIEGDGIAGVRRAFLAAGAESVVSTIWDVPVDSTQDLFVHFYECLKAGFSRTDALDEAKLVIAKSYPGESYRYCGFQLYGATGPIKYFVEPDRLIIEDVSLKLNDSGETREYRLFLRELDRIGVKFEGPSLPEIAALKTAYRDGIWSIAALKSLSNDESFAHEVRECFNEVLHRMRATLGHRN